jgi:uncharacterized protein YqhQ
MWLRMILRLALFPIVAAVAYEILRWAGRHRGSFLATLLAWPGLALQALTTRRPDIGQVQTAIYALSGAAGAEIPLPVGLASPKRVDAKLQPLEGVESRESA